MKGGGSFYQAQRYVNPTAGEGAFKLAGGGCGCAGRVLMGGRTRRARSTGGFLPSLMGGLTSNGPLLVAPAMAQAARLFRNESERMSARHRRTNRRRKTRRTNRKAKNTRKA